jgi:hypothetical protein
MGVGASGTSNIALETILRHPKGPASTATSCWLQQNSPTFSFLFGAGDGTHAS